MEEQAPVQKKNNGALVAIVVVVLIAITAVTAFAYQQMNKKDDEAASANTPSPVAQEKKKAPTPAESGSTYKDGEYSVVGDYTSPGGAEQIGVKVTLKDGNIVDVSVEPKAFRPTSKVKQADFAANYKPFVVGKNIDEVKLDKVSGSSLTPKGFNDALDKIKQEAKA